MPSIQTAVFNIQKKNYLEEAYRNKQKSNPKLKQVKQQNPNTSSDSESDLEETVYVKVLVRKSTTTETCRDKWSKEVIVGNKKFVAKLDKKADCKVMDKKIAEKNPCGHYQLQN